MATRDPRYDILFEPVVIGPKTARNRFYQVPHCTGMGWLRPRSLAEMRGVKAEGGWAVVSTEYCSIHPSSDDLPFPYASLWDRDDVRAHALVTDKIHEHGALAGVELWHGGPRSANLYTREPSLGVDSTPSGASYPRQSRRMDLEDIRDLRTWHRQAALRARDAGFDIVYIYATHGYLLSGFLSSATNDRTDEYGGGVAKRTRLCRELIEETRDAVGADCAVAVRIAIDDGGGVDGVPEQEESHEIFSLLAELPDLWDVNVSDYSLEMGASRFVPEGALEPYLAFVRSATTKPVVSVGRFTSPDTMASQVRRGVLDFIGAARPSIADPFLPRKIEEGRLDEIRECIGCNICYSGDGLGVPIRCTQNPTMGEEWRRGWHPERIPRKTSEAKILVVGGGPSGLECAAALGRRGYAVMLADARRALGGRVALESRLPGLAEWARVRDHREQQLRALPNVEVFLESDLDVDDVALVGPDHVAIATGATWRRDGSGRTNARAVPGLAAATELFTPDDVMAGRAPQGRVVLFDDDGYYMGAALAELLQSGGASVSYLSPDPMVGPFAQRTMEQRRAQRRLIELGVTLELSHNLVGVEQGAALISCVYTGRERRIEADSLTLVTARTPRDGLFRRLRDAVRRGEAGAVRSVRAIGDAEAPSIIAEAVHAGHRYAREFDAPAAEALTRRDGAPYG